MALEPACDNPLCQFHDVRVRIGMPFFSIPMRHSGHSDNVTMDRFVYSDGPRKIVCLCANCHGAVQFAAGREFMSSAQQVAI